MLSLYNPRALATALVVSLVLSALCAAQTRSGATTDHEPIITNADVASFPKVGTGKLTGTVSSHEYRGPLRVSITKKGATAAFAAEGLKDSGEFGFDDLDPGEYLINVTDSHFCLRYKVAVRIRRGKTKKISIGRSQRIPPDLCEQVS
jgi:hypothetical protein